MKSSRELLQTSRAAICLVPRFVYSSFVLKDLVKVNCPICLSLKCIDVFLECTVGNFFECKSCDFIFFHSDVGTTSSLGNSIDYKDLYWAEELEASKNRAFGVSIARAAEVFILARKPIKNFLDIGTGPGFFLDAILKYLPDSDATFLGVEMFPPEIQFQTTHPGFRTGWLDQFDDESIDGGICIEVLEHLSSSEVKDLFSLLFIKATNGATFMFNTGLTEYVKNEDMAYLDPTVRGHISIWSVNALRKLVGHEGWTFSPIPNRSWAFLAEKCPESQVDLSTRVWSPVPENVKALCGSSNSQLLYLLGRDSLRAI